MRPQSQGPDADSGSVNIKDLELTNIKRDAMPQCIHMDELLLILRARAVIRHSKPQALESNSGLET